MTTRGTGITLLILTSVIVDADANVHDVNTDLDASIQLTNEPPIHVDMWVLNTRLSAHILFLFIYLNCAFIYVDWKYVT